jgi:hypothetical protein
LKNIARFKGGGGKIINVKQVQYKRYFETLMHKNAAI